MKFSEPDKDTQTHQETLGEEIASSISHGIGAVLSVAALVILVVLAAQRGDPWKIVSFSVYGSALILLYLASTFYHSLTNKIAKNVFFIFDHVFIYVLIAGTYTPITLISMRGTWGWVLFGLIWGMAVLGILFKIFLLGKLKILSVVFYIAMGWLVIIALRPMLEMIPTKMTILLFIGGILYTLGIIFYAWKKMPYNHFIWHLFVLTGSLTHFFGFLFFVI
ncbi:MAG: hypothetical protein APR63_09985 [Desulfuromonas sp. SDB]|nr:MAG: hypothetical protein APR63_09985 [Desulfuromonas sp. SDB]